MKGVVLNRSLLNFKPLKPSVINGYIAFITVRKVINCTLFELLAQDVISPSVIEVVGCHQIAEYQRLSI